MSGAEHFISCGRGGKMQSLAIVVLILLCHNELINAQATNTIVFVDSTTTAATVSTTSGMQNRVCFCVPTGTCQSNINNPNIDIRIVNMGTHCNSGMTYCCFNPGENIITDGSCGVRKIPATQQQQGRASFGAYPWQAALLTNDNTYFGSGVLITQRHVLTTAHKVSAYANGGFKVRLGEWNAQNVNEPYPYREYGVSKVYIHPSFNAQNLQNDVAVIQLNSNVQIADSPNINTACLPSGMPAAGTRCWVSGWGKDAFGSSGSYQSIMKEVDVPIQSQSDCENLLRGTRLGGMFILDRKSFLCAGGEAGKDACTGDGGSPLVCEAGGRWQVVGMVAWGIGCANGKVPGVYVNVFNYIPWISEQVNKS